MKTRKEWLNLHNRAGVGALLWLALTDEEGPVTFASQHLLSLGAFDVTHVPGALLVVRWTLVLLQRVGPGNKAADTLVTRYIVSKSWSFSNSLNDRYRYSSARTSQHTSLRLYSMSKHSLISVVLYAQPFVDLLLPCPLLSQPSAKPGHHRCNADLSHSRYKDNNWVYVF